RCPMLDTAVCDLAGHLPTSVLMPGGRPKALLRQLGGRLLPEPIVRRQKRGFAVPMGAWLAERLRDELHHHLFDGRLEAMGLDRRVMQRHFDAHTTGRADHTHRLFALLQLALWRRWLDGGARAVPAVGYA
ncbi:MAG: asparagine synthase-related protein, partial [Planctomycetota bacterium]